MTGKFQTTADVGRPKAEKPKDAVISLRTFPEVREAIDDYARREHRTIAQMTELLLREAIIARRQRDKESSKEIENLP
jgi:hypothetical protein